MKQENYKNLADRQNDFGSKTFEKAAEMANDAISQLCTPLDLKNSGDFQTNPLPTMCHPPSRYFFRSGPRGLE